MMLARLKVFFKTLVPRFGGGQPPAGVFAVNIGHIIQTQALGDLR